MFYLYGFKCVAMIVDLFLNLKLYSIYQVESRKGVKKIVAK